MATVLVPRAPDRCASPVPDADWPGIRPTSAPANAASRLAPPPGRYVVRERKGEVEPTVATCNFVHADVINLTSGMEDR